MPFHTLPTRGVENSVSTERPQCQEGVIQISLAGGRRDVTTEDRRKAAEAVRVNGHQEYESASEPLKKSGLEARGVVYAVVFLVRDVKCEIR
jgi:hypothetical protein